MFTSRLICRSVQTARCRFFSVTTKCSTPIPPPSASLTDPTKVYSEKIHRLADQISKLSLVDVMDLNELLKVRFHHEMDVNVDASRLENVENPGRSGHHIGCGSCCCSCGEFFRTFRRRNIFEFVDLEEEGRGRRGRRPATSTIGFQSSFD